MGRDWSKSKYYGWVKAWSARPLEPGVAYEAIQQKHFTCTPAGFGSQMYTLARSIDLAATVSVFDDRVIFTFYDPTLPLRPNMPAYPVVKRLRKASR
jgi:hypothetical protein